MRLPGKKISLIRKHIVNYICKAIPGATAVWATQVKNAPPISADTSDRVRVHVCVHGLIDLTDLLTKPTPTTSERKQHAT